MNTLISMQNLILKCMYVFKLFSEVGVTAHHVIMDMMSYANIAVKNKPEAQ